MMLDSPALDEHGTPAPLKSDDPPAPAAVDAGLPSCDPGEAHDTGEPGL